MRITVLAIGHKMPSWIEEGFREYTKRMPPEARVELIELKPGKDKDDEGQKLLDAVPPGAALLALDERGKPVTT